MRVIPATLAQLRLRISPRHRLLRRLLEASFLFFLIKGLLWLCLAVFVVMRGTGA